MIFCPPYKTKKITIIKVNKVNTPPKLTHKIQQQITFPPLHHFFTPVLTLPITRQWIRVVIENKMKQHSEYILKNFMVC